MAPTAVYAAFAPALSVSAPSLQRNTSGHPRGNFETPAVPTLRNVASGSFVACPARVAAPKRTSVRVAPNATSSPPSPSTKATSSAAEPAPEGIAQPASLDSPPKQPFSAPVSGSPILSLGALQNPADVDKAMTTGLSVVDGRRYPKPTGVSAETTELSLSAKCIPDIWNGLAEKYGDYTALLDEHHPGGTIRMTFAEVRSKVQVFSAGLQRLGVNPTNVNRVAFFAEDSAKWLIAEQAIMAAGAAAAVRGIDAPVEELMYIYDHSGSTALFVENDEVLRRLLRAGFDIKSQAQFVVMLYGSTTGIALPGMADKLFSFEDILDRGSDPTPTELARNASRDDVATILYTSGTTGHPKGVVLSHGNILAQLNRISIGNLDPLPGEVFVSVLPCWHIFERTAAYYCLVKGMTLVYSNIRRFRDDLAKHKPHVLIAVPRVFENLYATIMGKLRNASTLRKKMFYFFTAFSIAFIHLRRTVQNLSLKTQMSTMNRQDKFRTMLRFIAMLPVFALANLLVWKKMRAAVGGRVKVCVVGGGSLPEYIEDFFEAAAINICVGYGLTETSPVICNRFSEHNVRGSAGVPLPDTVVKIVDVDTKAIVPRGKTGDLYVKGPQVFSEYYKNKEATAKAFDADGFFHTGDLAYIGPDDDIVITGRSKDVIVLSNGENIEPAPIEDAIKASPLIDQIMLVGQDEKQLCALVVPDIRELVHIGAITPEFADRITLAQTDVERRNLGIQMMGTTEVSSVIMRTVTEGNQSRSNYAPQDKIRHVSLLLEPFSVANGMLTQTLKIKRNVVEEVYRAEIVQLCRA